MKAVIVSDTHGLESILEEVFERHRNEADLFLHCGDSELYDSHPNFSAFKSVKGNVDRPNCGFPEQIIEVFGGIKWLVVHGHQDGVHHSLLNLNYKAESIGAQVVCFGHIHRIVAAEYEGRIFINPGSLSSPRDRIEKTYAVCEWENSMSQFRVCFYTDKGQELEELRREFMLK